MSEKQEKNPNAVALGRLGAKARQEKLTPERRREIARNAIRARWAKAKKKRRRLQVNLACQFGSRERIRIRISKVGAVAKALAAGAPLGYSRMCGSLEAYTNKYLGLCGPGYQPEACGKDS